jgi:DNA-binding response OmpR family regulator
MRILIVEDEFIIALDNKVVLEDAGCKVGGIAATVQEAEELIDTKGWDAVVLDANLNGSSAEPVAERLRERDIPFVVLSGYSSDQMKRSARERPVSFQAN